MVNRRARRAQDKQPQTESSKAARRVEHILRYALAIHDKQHDKTTKLVRLEYAAATYAALVVMFDGDNEKVTEFINKIIGPNDEKFLALFEYIFHIGYGAAILDVKTEKITLNISR